MEQNNKNEHQQHEWIIYHKTLIKEARHKRVHTVSAQSHIPQKEVKLSFGVTCIIGVDIMIGKKEE